MREKNGHIGATLLTYNHSEPMITVEINLLHLL